jgi:hypothetical protein
MMKTQKEEQEGKADPSGELKCPYVTQVISKFQKEMLKREMDKLKSMGLVSDRTEEQKKESNKAAYIRFMFVQFEVNIAKKYAVTDAQPIHVRDNLYIGRPS